MPKMFETNFFYITVVFYILYPFNYPFPSLQYFLASITIVGITVIVVIVGTII